MGESASPQALQRPRAQGNTGLWASGVPTYIVARCRLAIKRARRCRDEILVADLERLAPRWIHSKGRGNRPASPRTVETRQDVVNKLLWFLRKERYLTCGTLGLQGFLAHVRGGCYEQGGRWGNAREREPVCDRTVDTYYCWIHALFTHLVERVKVLDISPIAEDRIERPGFDRRRVPAFTQDQQVRLFHASGAGRYPVRDRALLLLLLDTGARASEVCGLLVGHLNLAERVATLLGKGGKWREVPLSEETAEYLRRHLGERPPGDNDPVFLSEGGAALTRSGLLQWTKRLAERAGLVGIEMHPHQFRHTFSTVWDRSGGSKAVRRAIMGHGPRDVTDGYVDVGRAEAWAAHAIHSPVKKLLARVAATSNGEESGGSIGSGD